MSTVFTLTENMVEEFTQKAIKKECLLEDISEIEDNQNIFEFITVKHELPPADLEIKSERNDPLNSCNESYDIVSPFESFENVPSATSVLLKQETDLNIVANYKSQTHEIFLPEYKFNQGENLPIEQIAETSSRSNSLSYSDLLIQHRSIKAEQLQRHKVSPSTSLHSDESEHSKEKSYKCNVCHKRFNHSSELKRHVRIHSGICPFKCNVCSKEFNESKTLKRHQYIHTGERPYKCNLCHKKFVQSSDLKQHVRIHRGELPFKCNLCNKEFNLSQTLKRHQLIHTGERPYECNVCHKKFSMPSNLNRHETIHSEGLVLKCNKCRKKFNNSVSLNRHESHCENLYKCSICDERFNKSYMKEHRRIHSGERPYECNVCHKTFNRSSHLKRHANIHSKGFSFECSRNLIDQVI